jgi:hypothetical protein
MLKRLDHFIYVNHQTAFEGAFQAFPEAVMGKRGIDDTSVSARLNRNRAFQAGTLSNMHEQARERA